MKVFHNIFVLLFYGASLISGGAFFYRLHKERRSMWIGTLLSLFLLSLFFSSVFTVFTYSQEIQRSNFLSLAFSIGLFFFIFFFPRITFFHGISLLEALFIVLVLSLSYLLFLAAMYAFSSVLNLIHLRENQNFRYIIVLGCGILGEKMTPLLLNRVDKGISLLKKNPPLLSSRLPIMYSVP